MTWFNESPANVLSAIGIKTDAKRAMELANLFDGDLGGFYYVAMATPNGDEEAIKWILQAVAAALNERGWGFEKISRLLPADYLKKFVEHLHEGKIEKTFAREIFAELLVANKYKDTSGDVLFDYCCYVRGDKEKTIKPAIEWDWDALYEHADNLVYETRISMESMRIRPEDIISQITSQPKFKAVDASELDSIIDSIIANNKDQAAKTKEQPKLLQFFIGQTMKASKGKANAQVATERLKIKLGLT